MINDFYGMVNFLLGDKTLYSNKMNNKFYCYFRL
jgi:hypothetical protein